MAISVLTAPAATPVTLDQVKQQLRIDLDNEDELLEEIIASAVAHIEAATGHHLIERTVRQYVDELPADRCVSLEGWPVRRVLKVTGFATDGSSVVLDPDIYSLQSHRDPATIEFSGSLRMVAYPNGLEIDSVTGHDTSGPEVPSNIIRAILVLCEHWYEHRGSQSENSQNAIVPGGLDALLRPVRRVHL